MKKVLLLALLVLTMLSSAQKLTVMTEEYPPYNYNDKDVLSGLATEIIQEILFKAKIDYDLKLLPWTRGYKTIQEKDNTVYMNQIGLQHKCISKASYIML